MKIAIVDSGVQENYKDNKNIIGGCTFKYKGNKVVCIDNEYIDENGHGTNTFQVIQHYGSENNVYYIVKILDENNSASVEILMQALNYLSQSDIGIIHLSLAIINQNFSGMMELKRICNDVLKKNKIIICAQKNKTNIPSYPAAFESIIGVSSIYTNTYNEIWYDPVQSIQCYANAVAKLIQGLGNKHVFFGGTSKSAAVITGLLSRHLDQHNNYNAHDILSRLSVRDKWTVDSEVETSNEFRKYNYELSTRRKYSLELYSSVNHVLSKTLNKKICVDCFKPLPEQNIFIDGEKCYLFLMALEKEFSVEINVTEIFYTSVYSFNSIIDMLFKR